MGDIRIHVPQNIHIEYKLKNGLLTKSLLDLLNTLMLQSKADSNEQDDLLGLFADQAELLDQITESIMETRETSSFEQKLILASGNDKHYRRIQELGYNLTLTNWKI